MQMRDRPDAVRSGRRAASRRPLVPAAIVAALLVALLACLVPAGGASAQAPGPASGAAAPTPAEIRQLSELLSRPAIRDWLRAQAAATPAPDTSAAARPEGATQMIGEELDAARDQLRRLAAGIPALPAELATMRNTLLGEIKDYGVLALLGPLVLFAVLGTLCERVFWRLSARLRTQMIALPVETADERLAAAAWRTLYGTGVVAAFAGGSLGAFLALAWPPLLQEVVLTYLIVFLVVRLTLVAGRIVLAPGAERFRLLPIATATARYWFVWWTILVGAFYFAKGTFRLIPELGATLTTRTLAGIPLSFAVLVLALVAVWRRPDPDGQPRRHAGDGATWLVSVWLLAVWLTAFTGQTAPFDIGLTLLLVVLINRGLRRAVDHLLRQTGDAPSASTRPITVVAVERGLRIALVVAAALAIARSLGLDLTALAASDTAATRIVRGILNVIVIGLLADFVWQVARAWIDRRLGEVSAASTSGTEQEERHRQRLRTLFPIMRNLFLILLLLVAGLTALASLGVEVGPLIAGAGVIGIAVGFGAQTLVKDVISGLFFLFDDAFRVGEYIESGRIKGTVEAFSLRSVKLRHHRGPLHTVPFGALSAITNYSRDWVIDKITLGLAYDTDLDKVKRVVREVGRELEQDPDFAPHILEPLKMQGVSSFGDFALQVETKMMMRPGEQQYLIRHRAHALIKQAFSAAGIQFAYPTVAIAGGGAVPAAVAAAAGLQRSVPTREADRTDAAG